MAFGDDSPFRDGGGAHLGGFAVAGRTLVSRLGFFRLALGVELGGRGRGSHVGQPSACLPEFLCISSWLTHGCRNNGHTILAYGANDGKTYWHTAFLTIDVLAQKDTPCLLNTNHNPVDHEM